VRIKLDIYVYIYQRSRLGHQLDYHFRSFQRISVHCKIPKFLSVHFF